MQFLVLKVVGGPEAGKKVTVRAGQRLRVGRSPRADFCLAKDATLTDFHFVLDCTRGQCNYQLLEGSPPGNLGAQKLVAETLYDGDQFEVGGSAFAVRIEGQLSGGRPAAQNQNASAKAAVPAAPALSGYVRVQTPAAELILARLDDLPEEIVAAHASGQTPKALVDALIATGAMNPALQFLTHALPKREAVWALATAIETLAGSTLGPADLAGVAAAKAWAGDPSEENRRLAETQSKLLKRKSPAGYAAQAAFWSDGSMAPPDAEPVPVLDTQCATMVIGGALQLAAAQPDYDAALQKLVAHWTAVADAAINWET